MPATDFHINGPTVIKWSAAGAGSRNNLGYTDNDDLVRISMIDHKRTYTRNDGGDMIAEGVYAGSTATLDLTLVSWDEGELASLISRCRTGTASSGVASQGGIATVGKAASSNLIALEIEPTNTGADVYLFPKMMLQTGPEIMDLGNAVKRISMSFISFIPNSGGTTFATVSNKAP